MVSITIETIKNNSLCKRVDSKILLEKDYRCKYAISKRT